MNKTRHSGRAVIGGLIFAKPTATRYSSYRPYSRSSMDAPRRTRLPCRGDSQCLSSLPIPRMRICKAEKSDAMRSFLLIVAVALGGLGRGPAGSLPETRARQGNCGRRDHHGHHDHPRAHIARRGTRAARHRAGVHRGADLRAHQRLSQRLAHGYRRASDQGPVAG